MGYWNEVKEKLDNVYKALQDDESRKLFDARVQYMIAHNDKQYIDRIYELNKLYPKKWRCPEIEKRLEGDQTIIIYGCGHDGEMIKNILEVCNYSVIYWCDSNRNLWGTYKEGIKVISPEDLGKNYKESLLIIGSKKYELEIRRRLYDIDFPTKNIFTFVYNHALCGKQYFDMFAPKDYEVFVDAGAYNGDSINVFLEWVRDKEYKVYAIEPLEDMCEVIKDKHIPNVEIVNCAAWNKNEKLCFDLDARGSTIREKGLYLGVGMIDEIVKNDKVSFIKMDIEGAELKALEGAKETILKYKPRLAICIYHKYEDIYKIGDYILSLNPNYKLYIRHYTTCMWETVLYAV